MARLINRLLKSRGSIIFSISVSVLILLLSVLPLDKIPDDLNLWDKASHFIAYLLLYLCWDIIWEKLNKKRAAKLILVIFLYGVFLELIQEFIVVSRNGDWQDIVANGIGVLFGTIFSPLLRKLSLTKKLYSKEMFSIF